jgi:CheY-like chemotaxis protein
MSRELILVVEDDEVTRAALECRLQAEGYEVVGAADATQAIKAAQQRRPDLMILDLTLLGDDPFSSLNDGFAALQWLRIRVPNADFPVIVHTGDPSPNVDRRAKSSDTSFVFRKGQDPEDLLRSIRLTLDARKKNEAA